MAERRRKRTPDFDRKAVVMLDRLVERYGPDAWPVSAVRDTVEEARQVGQYDGAPPTLLSRTEYAATPAGSVTLLDVRSGETSPARIYRMERREGV